MAQRYIKNTFLQKNGLIFYRNVSKNVKIVAKIEFLTTEIDKNYYFVMNEAAGRPAAL